MTFDEFINADKLRQNLIITPQTDTRYKPLVKKNRLTIEFEQPFQDSITYTFNFINSVTDITERNPVENLILAFSTGPFIDSMSISGKVVDLLTQQPQEQFIAALYPSSDTLDFSTDKPMYFATTGEDGTFQINYIKSGTYKLLSFKDENSNLLLESQIEPHAFLSDSILLDSVIQDLTLQTVLLDVRKPQLINARPFGVYFQARYNKPIIKYSYTTPTDSAITLYSRLTEDRESIQFYPNPLVTDSLQLILTAQDTTTASITDTLYLKYTPSTLRPEDLTYQLTPKDNATIRDTLLLQLTFNKPITSFNPDQFILQNDTLITLQPDTLLSSYNYNNTELSLALPWNWSNYADTLTKTIKSINDSLEINPSFLQQIQVLLDTGAFISIQQDSSSSTLRTYKKFTPSETGIITYELQPQNTNVVVQLIDKDYEVITELSQQPSGTFNNVKPGTYGLRILLDTDANGIWTYGNLNTDTPPEPVLIYEDFTELRANWEVNLPTIDISNLLINP